MAEGNGGGGGGDSGATAGVRVEAHSAPPKLGSIKAGMPLNECVEGIRSALKDPTVQFLRERLEKAGCPLWPSLIRAATCNSGGAYNSGYGIRICCNNVSFQDHITQVLTHELIHAYDDCVAKNIDWNNCAHHVCSEIRANHLSGNCHYKYELLRGFMKIKGHEQECVKRRALMSLEENPHCSKTAAKDALEAVWDICYNDTRPFDRAP